MNFNKVILGGRLVASPEVRTLPASGTELCTFRMAINSSWPSTDGKRTEEVCFVDVAHFGARAPFIKKYFGKGSHIIVEGRLRHEVWDSEESTGKKITRSKHSIVADDFFFVDPKSRPINRDEPAHASSSSSGPGYGSGPGSPPVDGAYAGAPPVNGAPNGAPAVPTGDLTHLEGELGLSNSTFDGPAQPGLAGRMREQVQSRQLAAVGADPS
ncbi:MAG TPA: single-stranded DNA-binding protein [Aeromicrobium sp.]|nr:single-stranded DNA-binding protein [Aeromicrobium sp.]